MKCDIGGIQSTEGVTDRGETAIFHLRLPKARKNHVCHGCGEIIGKGTRYVRYTTHGLEGPGWEDWTLHGECYLDNQPMFYGTRPRPEERWQPEVQP